MAGWTLESGRGQVVYEYGNFNADYESRTQRFDEILDIILGLWSTPGFTYKGEYYQVDDMTIGAVADAEAPPADLFSGVENGGEC